MPRLDPDRAARVLADAVELGDKGAADKWGISEKTVRRYRQRVPTDSQLSTSVRRVAREEERGWQIARRRFLREGVEKLRTLISQATVQQLDDVSRALERIGNIDVASEALGVGAGGTDSEGASAPEDGGGDGDPDYSSGPH